MNGRSFMLNDNDEEFEDEDLDFEDDDEEFLDDDDLLEEDLWMRRCSKTMT